MSERYTCALYDAIAERAETFNIDRHHVAGLQKHWRLAKYAHSIDTHESCSAGRLEACQAHRGKFSSLEQLRANGLTTARRAKLRSDAWGVYTKSLNTWEKTQPVALWSQRLSGSRSGPDQSANVRTSL